MASSLSLGSRRGRGAIVGINVTPFVDIALVLLIIMMVSATYIVSRALKVELPRSATSDESVSRTFVVTISKEGRLLFNDAPVTLANLGAELKAARKSENPNLVITADQDARHGRVVEVIDTAKLAGVSKFAINVKRK